MQGIRCLSLYYMSEDTYAFLCIGSLLAFLFAVNARSMEWKLERDHSFFYCQKYPEGFDRLCGWIKVTSKRGKERWNKK